MPLSSITKPEDMNLTAISALVFVLVAIKTLVNAIQERKRQEKANRDFAHQACQMFNLPREVTWHKGGKIVADLDAQGNSILLFRRKKHHIPKSLSEAGVQSWNISPREAKIIVEIVHSNFTE